MADTEEEGAWTLFMSLKTELFQSVDLWSGDYLIMAGHLVVTLV